jgi:hypothetical protein
MLQIRQCAMRGSGGRCRAWPRLGARPLRDARNRARARGGDNEFPNARHFEF